VSGWKSVALSEVADIERNGVEASAIRDGTLYVGLENIQSGGDFLNVRAVDEGELASSKFAFTGEHLLYGKLRPYLAKIARPWFAGVCSTDIVPIKPGPRLDRDYLSHFLRQPSMVDFANSRATGANLPRLSPRVLAGFEVPLPPLPEQRRIAAILDQADTLRTQRRAALAQLDSLTQSLFLDMFGDPVTNPKCWPDALKLGEVADIVSGVTKGRNLDGKATRELPYLAVANVQDKFLKLDAVKTIEATEDEISKYRIRKNDLLLTEGGDPDKLGRGTLWNDDLPECIHQNHVFRVRITSAQFLPLFLNWLVGSQRGKDYFLRSAKQTTGIASINMTQLRGFPLLAPPLPLQQTFATRVQAIEALKTQHRAALAEADALFASLQQRAFAGGL